MESRLISDDEIDRELMDVKREKDEVVDRLNLLNKRIERLKDLKDRPLGPRCPVCGDMFKNNRGLKIHVKLKSKYNPSGEHANALSFDRIMFIGGKVAANCAECGDVVVLNGRREDRRIDENGDVVCIFCRCGVDDE